MFICADHGNAEQLIDETTGEPFTATQSCGSFLESIGILSKILNVRGDIIPATTQVIKLFARMADGTIVRGESNIPNMNNRIDTVFYQETVKASEKAVRAIREADVIIYGCSGTAAQSR